LPSVARAWPAQAKLKKQQWPWTLAKSFKHSTPVGTACHVEELDLQDLELRLTVNGAGRQQGNTRLMLWPVDVLLQYTLRHFPVRPGDLLLTGTPAGVSPLQAGDRVEAQLLRGSGGPALSTGVWVVGKEVTVEG
jgi:2-keto-4-pentenoate hydratase/2-oxohepta-3-ene-1,7-dioic acid hydratase in catechol pathway